MWASASSLLTSGEFMERVWDALARGQARQALDLARYLRERLPGHLQAMWAEAQAWEALGQPDLSRAACEAILQRDPEHPEARQALERSLDQGDAEGAAGLRAFLEATAETAAQLARLEALWRQGNAEEALPLAQDLAELPKAMLILACLRMEAGRDVEGAALFHDALAQEPSLTIARRVLAGHPLEQFLLEPMLPWPEGLEEAPVHPAGAPPSENPPKAAEGQAAQDRLEETAVEGPAPLADQGAPEALDPLLREMQAELERIAETLLEREQSPLRVEGRRAPIAILLVTSRAGLERAFRAEGARAVLERLRALAAACQGRGQVVRTVVVDDQEGVAPFAPADPADPADVKRLLLQVKEAMEKGGQRPGYVLLVGGHRVLPPFRLPNPAEDDDPDILTDGPYGCPEGETLVPHWAVGRLPDGDSPRPDILLRLLDGLVRARLEGNGHRRGLWGALRWPWARPDGGNGQGMPSLGFSASLWR
ncbi:MAG: hypothetical protein H5T59_07400, partial [Anaerolineae bacterium]|nr:hypothetical protein [Anaerolineae bacterium]